MKLPRIKVCGLRRAEDAAMAVELGAWAIGFVFWSKSPRAVTPADARQIVDSVPARGVLRVGVFVDATVDEILATVDAAQLSAVQLHGSESANVCADVKARLPNVRVFKALRPRAGEKIDAETYAKSCDALLIDAHSTTLPGGTGQRADWSAAAEISKIAPLILAGGLNETNVGEALSTVRPFALDVSSGLESAPGEKDHSKMRAFFEQVGKGAST